MRLVLELAMIVLIVLVGAAIRSVLSNLEDDAFDAELTAISNERALRMRGMNA